jgi:thiamine pyrophosphate-dependent acetolactate synthase large subunit-like protein
MIPRSQALKHLAALRTDEIVLTAMMAVRQWAAFSDHQLDFSTIGTGMGHASDIGLGLALAQPDRRVIVLNGDGSMLMNLGQLVTIAQQAPPNLILMVLHNGTYEVTGGQPIPGPANLDFAGMARAAGIAKAYDFHELDAFTAALPDILSGQGPIFVNLRVVADEIPLPPPSRQPLPQRAAQLMQALEATP